VTAVLTVGFWGAWEWASSDGHPTVGLVAGILLVASGIALAGFVVITLLGLARRGARLAGARRSQARGRGQGDGRDGGSAPATGSASRRIAA